MKNLYTALLLTALTFGLGGCVWVAAGVGAGTGYYVGKDERSAGQIAKDAATTSKVKTALIRDPIVKAFDINVDTYNDEVTLKGHVNTEEQRSRAEELTWSIKNVKAVTNHLAVIY